MYSNYKGDGGMLANFEQVTERHEIKIVMQNRLFGTSIFQNFVQTVTYILK